MVLDAQCGGAVALVFIFEISDISAATGQQWLQTFHISAGAWRLAPTAHLAFVQVQEKPSGQATGCGQAHRGCCHAMEPVARPHRLVFGCENSQFWVWNTSTWALVGLGSHHVGSHEFCKQPQTSGAFWRFNLKKGNQNIQVRPEMYYCWILDKRKQQKYLFCRIVAPKTEKSLFLLLPCDQRLRFLQHCTLFSKPEAEAEWCNLGQ